MSATVPLDADRHGGGPSSGDCGKLAPHCGKLRDRGNGPPEPAPWKDYGIPVHPHGCATSSEGSTGLAATPEHATRRARRGDRYRLRAELWELSTSARMRRCGRIRIAKDRAIEVRTVDGVAHLAGLQLCGSVWLCPVCGPKVRAARAEEIDTGLRRWIERGGGVLFATLTVPHQRAHRLADLVELQKRAWALTFAGRPWRADRDQFGVSHYVRAWDTTRGVHGWHPHLHVAILTDAPLAAGELAELRARISDRWADAVEGAGHPRPHSVHGVVIERGHAESLGAYVAKVRGEDDAALSWELARGDLKTSGGLPPWAVLARGIATGDLDDLDAWKEWETAMPGSHLIRWSRGAKADLEIGERTDEEITEEEIGGETLATISGHQWATIVSRGPRAVADLLDAAELGGAPAVRAVLAGLARGSPAGVSWRAPPN